MMQDAYSTKFIKSLVTQELSELQTIPKADLHNHFVLGGSREYIQQKTGIQIPFLNGKLESMQAMHDWNNRYIGEHFNNYEMRKLLIEATFYQAKSDGISILEIGEDVWANNEFYQGDVSFLIDTFQSVQQEIAP